MVLPAGGDGGGNVVGIPGEDDSDRGLAVVGGVVGVGGAVSLVEQHLTPNVSLERSAERFDVDFLNALGA